MLVSVATEIDFPLKMISIESIPFVDFDLSFDSLRKVFI